MLSQITALVAEPLNTFPVTQLPNCNALPVFEPLDLLFELAIQRKLLFDQPTTYRSTRELHSLCDQSTLITRAGT